MKPDPMTVLAVLAVLLISAAAALTVRAAAADPSADPAAGQAAKETDDMAHATTNVSTVRYSRSGHDLTPPTAEQIKELAKALTPEQHRVILGKGTERAFCGDLLDNKTPGIYGCRLCGLPLFGHDAKFNSGTGWPSYDRPIDADHVAYHKDVSLGMTRVEITCARCGGHLGHVFDDGPTDSGQRYCLNSASLEFFADGTELPARSRPIPTETAYFAGGCFWGIEHYLQHEVPGVIDVVSGYQGGHVDKPTYKQVCYTDTGHAESVRITYDPARVTYRQLLEIFFKIHDPTQVNRQGPDVGTQYRSAIFAADEAQLKIAQEFIAEQAKLPRFAKKPIATQVNPFATFYEAEDYHQDYNERTGRPCHLNIYEE